jgi:hypothetical protein
MFRRIHWVVVLLTTALLYFSVSAAPALSQAPSHVEFSYAG